jgi:hypothetical protein
MADPRKPVHQPDPNAQDSVREIAYRHLLAVTELGAREIGCSGASFVMIGLGIWAAELHDLDPKAAAQLLRSLATLYDPKASDNQKRAAEKKRHAAVTRLHAAVDLDMATPKGEA